MNKKFWQHKNVFVTGGTGLLGSWLINYLTKTNAIVTTLIRDGIPRSNLFLGKTFSKINTVDGAIEDYLLIERILTEYEIDTVFHLAAQTIAPIANANPLSTFETNIKGTWTILEACRRSPLVKRIIVASSDKVYGDSDTLPYTEETPLKGKHPYDVSKSCADLLAQAYFASYSLPVCITRCGNLFGGGDLNFNRLFPSVIRSALFKEQPLLRSDGNSVRDFFYVEDAVLGIIQLAQKMDMKNKKPIIGEAFNYSNEDPLTVLNMGNRILKRMKSRVSLKILNESKNEIRKQYLSAKKAHSILKWQPIFTLDEGIDKTIDWYRSFFNLNKNSMFKMYA